ncbi:MAG: Hint domain-containing protein [Roseovarius sp.]|nr:Hint domain-containing protein [Roseovarius sp.]
MLGWIGSKTGKPIHGMVQELGGVMTGLVSGTRVATAIGWRPVEALTAGDRVLTFDNGLQPLVDVNRQPLWSGKNACPQNFWPLELARGALGNRGSLTILPHQVVMLESDTAEEIWGDPFALLPALALDGANGVSRVPPARDAEVSVLHFEEEQVVFAEHGLMFLCPSSRDLLDYAFTPEDALAYCVLPINEARRLTMALEASALFVPNDPLFASA